MKLSIVVPCYNEEENIPLILERFEEIIEQKDIEVILVNNGSTDNSAQILADLLPKYSFVKTVLVEVNQGYGYGILQGLHMCRGSISAGPMRICRRILQISSKRWRSLSGRGVWFL